MANNVTNIGKDINQEKITQEALGQRKLNKLFNWWNTRAYPALETGYKKLLAEIANIRINWGGILVMVILVIMAQNGAMDNMPNLKWFVESAMRLTEWCLNLLRSFIDWFVNFLDSKFVNMFDILGILEWAKNFLRDIFAL